MTRNFKMTMILSCVAAVLALVGARCPAADYPSVEWVYRAKPDISPKSIVFPDDDTLVFQ
jgi:hypothetical protein